MTPGGVHGSQAGKMNEPLTELSAASHRAPSVN